MKKTKPKTGERISRAGHLAGKTVVLGVTGSIAAYKAVSLVRRLREAGAVVQVLMTPTAQRFVGPVTFQVLTGRPVGTDLFAADQFERRSCDPLQVKAATGTPTSRLRSAPGQGEQGPVSAGSGREGASIGCETEMPHLSLADAADLIVIAPATAHSMAKLAHGLADDLLSTVALAAVCPVLIVPAMDGGMWDHPAVRTNVRTLRTRHVTVMEPPIGPLASGRVGIGRFPDEEAILTAISGLLTRQKDFRGKRVLITAGPTQEALDPIRFLSNRSSGKMGWALAEAARDRGAEVTLIAGPTNLPKVSQVSFIPIVTSEELRKTVYTRIAETDVLIMAAAVADFRPVQAAPRKIPKGSRSLTLTLEPTPDILRDLPRHGEQLVVGFAAETGNLVERARHKLAAKNLDMIVANDVTEPGAGFGTDTNRVTLLDRHGYSETLPLMSKREVADRVLDAVQALMSRGSRSTPTASRHRLRNPKHTR